MFSLPWPGHIFTDITFARGPRTLDTGIFWRSVGKHWQLGAKNSDLTQACAFQISANLPQSRESNREGSPSDPRIRPVLCEGLVVKIHLVFVCGVCVFSVCVCVWVCVHVVEGGWRLGGGCFFWWGVTEALSLSFFFLFPLKKSPQDRKWLFISILVILSQALLTRWPCPPRLTPMMSCNPC